MLLFHAQSLVVHTGNTRLPRGTRPWIRRYTGWSRFKLRLSQKRALLSFHSRHCFFASSADRSELQFMLRQTTSLLLSSSLDGLYEQSMPLRRLQRSSPRRTRSLNRQRTWARARSRLAANHNHPGSVSVQQPRDVIPCQQQVGSNSPRVKQFSDASSCDAVNDCVANLLRAILRFIYARGITLNIQSMLTFA
jgi:hypothetical protein